MAAPATPLTVWRILPLRRADQPFSGEGARLFGGRWNHRGIAVVYTSASLSLAALELFVHLDPDLAPRRLAAASALVPEDLELPRLEVRQLPRDWRDYPAPDGLKDLGTEWARSGRGAALAVPSALIPTEWNVLLNPAHPGFKKVRLRKPQPFSYDPRMWKKPGRLP